MRAKHGRVDLLKKVIYIQARKRQAILFIPQYHDSINYFHVRLIVVYVKDT